MLLAPATLVVLLVAAALAIGGVIIIFLLIVSSPFGRRDSADRPDRAGYEIDQLRRAAATRVACPNSRCAHPNPNTARYCAMCGQELTAAAAAPEPQSPSTRE